MSPGEEVIKEVKAWVMRAATIAKCEVATSTTVHGDYIKVETCVEKAEELLGVKLHEYRHA